MRVSITSPSPALLLLANRFDSTASPDGNSHKHCNIRVIRFIRVIHVIRAIRGIRVIHVIRAIRGIRGVRIDQWPNFKLIIIII
jgi:hypothetical protein